MDFYASLNTSQLNVKKPTIFEVALCSQLDNLLTPSLRYLLAHYTHIYPRALIRILNNFDELNLALRSFIEFQYLKSWNSTFIEKFYGIKRIKSSTLLGDDLEDTPKITDIKRLSFFQIFMSIVDSVVVPYVDVKLQLYHDKLVPQYLLNTINIERTEKSKDDTLSLKLLCMFNKLKKLIKDAFFKYYPLAKLFLKMVTLLLNILYIADKTSSISIIQLLSKISYSRITNADHQRMDSMLSSGSAKKLPKNVPQTMTSIVVSNLKAVTVPIRKIAWSTTDTILPMSIFTLKFLEWYNTQRSSQTDNGDKSMADVPIVPSIVPIGDLEDEETRMKYITSTEEESACRICGDTIHNPAVIETGYVFCYKCIYEYLRDQSKEDGGKCPVSGRKLFGCTWNDITEEWNVKQIRKLII